MAATADHIGRSIAELMGDVEIKCPAVDIQLRRVSEDGADFYLAGLPEGFGHSTLFMLQDGL